MSRRASSLNRLKAEFQKYVSQMTRGKVGEATAGLETLLKKMERMSDVPPSFKNLVFSSISMCYFGLNKYNKAFKYFRTILRTDAYSDICHRGIFQLFDMPVDKRVANSIRQTLRASDDFASSILLSVACFIEENPKEMLSNLLKAQEASPDNPYLLYYFSQCSRLKREYDWAIKFNIKFIQMVPEIETGYTNLAHLTYEMALQLLRLGKYQEARDCLLNGGKNVRELCDESPIKSEERQLLDQELIRIQANMSALSDVIGFDLHLEKMLTASSLKELAAAEPELREYFGIFAPHALEVMSPTITQLLVHKLAFAFTFLVVCRFQELSGEVADIEKRLNDAREFFKREGFQQGKQAVDATENFFCAVTRYNALDEVPKENELEVLNLLRPAYWLVRELTLLIAERQRADLFKTELVTAVREEIRDTLAEPKEKLGLQEHGLGNQGAEYARMWNNRTATEGIVVDKNRFDELNANKSAYEIFVVDNGEYSADSAADVYLMKEKGKEKQLIKVDLKPLQYRILVHTLKRKGVAGDAITLAEACWLQPDFGRSLREEWEKVLKGEVKSRKPFTRRTQPVRSAVSVLNAVFRKYLAVRLRSHKKSVYKFRPIPTFCLLTLAEH